MSLSEFGNDPGTLYYDSGSEPFKLSNIKKRWFWKLRLRRYLKKRPIVWFVDDESGNRKWFADYHRKHFGILTFSSRKHCSDALQSGTPCDAVVTDIFFPAKKPTTDDEAKGLLDIYNEIKNSCVDKLPELWKEVQNKWSLDGFDVARDTTDIAKNRKERIPVLFFSRKATLLLNRDDWLDESPTVENTFWLLEKVDPNVQGEAARRAASIQRDRIRAALRYRQAAALWWLKILRGIGLKCGPLSFSLER